MLNSATYLPAFAVVLFFMNVCPAAKAQPIVNHSFETGLAQWDPPGWESNHRGNSAVGPGTFGKRILSEPFLPESIRQDDEFKTHGHNFFYMWTGHRDVLTEGTYINLYQSVDLTAITEVIFDAALYAPFGWEHVAEAQFLVDDTVLWNATLDDVYLDQAVDVRHYSGVGVIELRLRATESGISNSHWVLWDNFRAIPEPTSVAMILLSLAGAATASCWRYRDTRLGGFPAKRVPRESLP